MSSSTGKTAPEAPLAGSSIRVVTHRTGIAAGTLRMWERRYGFPTPARRSGGSRVYAEADVAKLKLVSRALEAGFRAGEVVPLPAADLARLLDAAEPDLPRAARAQAPGEVSVDALLDALAADEVALFTERLAHAVTALGPRQFVTDVAHPLAARVGELWARGELEVRHEHLASACLTRRLHALLDGFPLGDSAARPRVVLATLPGETHVLPIDMIAVFIAAAGGAPHVLGPDMPPAQLAAEALSVGADAVGVSVSAAADRDRAEADVRALLAELPRKIALWIGGGGGRGLAASADGVVHVATFGELDREVEKLRGPAAPSAARLVV